MEVMRSTGMSTLSEDDCAALPDWREPGRADDGRAELPRLEEDLDLREDLRCEELRTGRWARAPAETMSSRFMLRSELQTAHDSDCFGMWMWSHSRDMPALS